MAAIANHLARPRGFRISAKLAVNLAYSARYVQSSASILSARKGLIVGVYERDGDQGFSFSPAAKSFDEKLNGTISKVIGGEKSKFSKGKCRVLYPPSGSEYDAVAIAHVGPESSGLNELEEIDEKKENLRIAVAAGVRALRDHGMTEVVVDTLGDSHAAAEGAFLSQFVFDRFKSKKDKNVSIRPTKPCAAWRSGEVYAEAQNFARTLAETPANYMTPSLFVDAVAEKLRPFSSIEVQVRDRAWAENKKMGAFLGVARGSDEPPKFMVIRYNGGKAAPVALVGKGVTFDTGGISIKPSASMDEMRGDMGGAASVVGTLLALAKLQTKMNVVALIPLCENMPSGKALKPGDVVTAMDGTTIQVDNTDAEGRLILADALIYSREFKPRVLLDMATLTGAMRVALGASAAGVFTNSSAMWQRLHASGTETGDRLWRMPLWRMFQDHMSKDCMLADLNNISKPGRQGGACTAAGFLSKFAQCKHWLHLDIAGVMGNQDEVPYLAKGMSGRPTRSIIGFMQKIAEDQMKLEASSQSKCPTQ